MQPHHGLNVWPVHSIAESRAMWRMIQAISVARLRGLADAKCGLL